WDLGICLLFSCLFFFIRCSDPNIDASWYTGRGIRPVGRFGRRAAQRNKRLATLRLLLAMKRALLMKYIIIIIIIMKTPHI
uniref:Prolactin-releasing peptide n=1 Tax=Scophthalmus maximus TaxID=52904 RepID=A0A8D2ZF58_SCOMX